MGVVWDFCIIERPARFNHPEQERIKPLQRGQRQAGLNTQGATCTEIPSKYAAALYYYP